MPPATTAKDASGGTVGSLTEAMMGVTAGLMAIANAIEQVAVEMGNQNAK